MKGQPARAVNAKMDQHEHPNNILCCRKFKGTQEHEAVQKLQKSE
jgi:hypothetical protein